MTSRGKTIQVFLTDGSPRGIKTAEITSNIELAIFIPRNKIKDAGVLDSINTKINDAGIYFLFGEDDYSTKPLVYVGQSRNCYDRVKNHDQNKDFWNHVVIVLSKTNSFTTTHVEYLEQLAIDRAIKSNRYILKNSISPNQLSVPAPLEADLLDNFDTIKILLSTLGFTLFEPLKSEDKNSEILFCRGRETLGTGEYQDDGFVVFKGSTAKSIFAPTTSESNRKLRKRLVSDKILMEDKGRYIFNDDFIFNSPSAAASQILGRNANGWIEWKSEGGITLSKLKRD